MAAAVEKRSELVIYVKVAYAVHLARHVYVDEVGRVSL
jgi:hypothetical protein